MEYLAAFWTSTAFLGLVVTSRNLGIAFWGWRLLQTTGAPPSVIVMAWSHVRTHAIMIWLHFTFVIVGVLATIPHERGSAEYWVSTCVVMSIPLFLIVLSVTAAMDRAKAGKKLT